MTVAEALRILEMAPPLSEASLKSAYRKLAKRFHPDRYASYDRKVWAGEKFVRVKEAYDLIKVKDLSSLEQAEGPPAPAPRAAPVPPRTSVFDHYADQADFTERDFIAWQWLWRFGSALLRAFLQPLARLPMLDAPQLQTSLGCLILVPLLLLGVLLFPVVAMLVLCFGFHVFVQKVVIAAIEKAFETRIGPDSRHLSGQLLYLGLLALGAGLAAGLAVYALSLQTNRDWITEAWVWAFVITLALTWLLEVGLFLKARLLQHRLSRHLESALRLAD